MTNMPAILGIGIIAMLIPIMIQSKWKEVPVWKSIIISLVLLVAGTVGIYVWFYIENFEWGGRSFFGAVFLVPLACIPVARLLKLDYGILTDISAPAGCAMLALMKVKCYLDECCRGIRLYRDEMGVAHFFPSQLVELINAIILCIVLLRMAHSHKKEKSIYAWFLILYGATRFVLNFFRSGTKPYLLMLPAGNVWSLVAIGIGLIWLRIVVKRNKKEVMQ